MIPRGDFNHAGRIGTKPGPSVHPAILATLSHDDQKAGFNAIGKDAIPHHFGSPLRFDVREFDQLAGLERNAVVSHAKATGADVHQRTIDFPNLGIGELDMHGSGDIPPYFASFFAH
jgi:hypothetical protein